MFSIGQKIGYFTVLDAFKKRARLYLKCQCICGTVIEIRSDSILRTNRANRSCGCLGGVAYGPKRKSNSIEIFSDHAEILITHKGNSLKILIDKDMVPEIKKYRWYYSGRYIQTRYKFKQIIIHYLILPKKEGYVIDHINRNPFDNRRVNLRYATILQNSWNRAMKDKPFRGVYFNRNDGKWKASAVINGRKVLIDSFNTRGEGLLAYDFIIKLNRGEFSVPNVVELDKEFLTRWKEKIMKRLIKEQERMKMLQDRIDQITTVLTSSSNEYIQDTHSQDVSPRDNPSNLLA